MSSIAEQLTRINAAKESLSGVLVENGITPPATFEEYADAASGINRDFRDAFVGRVNGTLTEVDETLLGGATKLADYAFAGCTSLSAFSGETITGAVGNNAFYGCKNLEELYLPNAISVGKYAFRDCSKIGPILELPNVKTIDEYAFSYATGLRDISFPKAETIGSNAFNTVVALSAVSFPVATTIGTRAFDSKTQLRDISFPSATSVMANAFDGCTNLSAVSLPSVASIQAYVFKNCKSLSTVSLPTITMGAYAFQDCTGLSSLSLPNLTALLSCALQGCTALSSLEIPACQTLTTPFRTSYSATAKLSNLVSLSLPSITTISARAFGATATQQYTGIVDLYFPNKTVAQVKAMSNYSTWHCGSGCTIHASDGSFLYGS